MTIELNPQLRLVVADCEKQINVDDGKKHTKKKGDKSRICAPSKHLRIKEANPRPVRSQCIDNVAAAAVVGEKNEEKKKKKKKKQHTHRVYIRIYIYIYCIKRKRCSSL